MYSDCEFDSDEYKGIIPLENAYRVAVRYHLVEVTKKLVIVLLTVYPELCVYDNDED